ncbi:MAG: hypothetical protein IPJ47_05445 [Anaerolineales bacterium]|nr:hypothetical protein [Anaerolineales bacterium]
MKLLNNLNKRIQQIASVRLWLLLTLIMFGLGYAMTSSISPSAELMSLAGGRNVPDTQFWRSADSLYSQLTDYGAHGRRLYLTRVSPVDLFIPLAQALFLSVAITLLFRQVFQPDSAWQLLNTLPFAAMVGDYLENASIVSIIVAYPNRLDALALAAAFFTAIKFIASLASIGLIILGVVIWLMNKGKK